MHFLNSKGAPTLCPLGGPLAKEGAGDGASPRGPRGRRHRGHTAAVGSVGRLHPRVSQAAGAPAWRREGCEPWCLAPVFARVPPSLCPARAREVRTGKGRLRTWAWPPRGSCLWPSTSPVPRVRRDREGPAWPCGSSVSPSQPPELRHGPLWAPATHLARLQPPSWPHAAASEAEWPWNTGCHVTVAGLPSGASLGAAVRPPAS